MNEKVDEFPLCRNNSILHCTFLVRLVGHVAVFVQQRTFVFFGSGLLLVLFATSGFLFASVHNSVFLVHHAQNRDLVRALHRCYRDVSNRSEITTIVQVLVLQSKEVPNKTSAMIQDSDD